MTVSLKLFSFSNFGNNWIKHAWSEWIWQSLYFYFELWGWEGETFYLENYTLKIFLDQVSKKYLINRPVEPRESMSHNLLFIGFLSVLPLLVFLCLLIICRRAVTSNVDPHQIPSAVPSSTLPDQQPMIPKRRSRTQETLRSEYELSKYQNPIIKCQDEQDNWLDRETIIFVFF